MKSTEQDPFAIFLAPPANETPRERKEREARDAEAKRINKLIDAQLQEDRIALEKERHVVRVLMLGQSGSGKSTAVKLFRMRYAWKEWDAERMSWLPVIQLNVVNSILTIVEALRAEQSGGTINIPIVPFASVSRTPNTSSISNLPAERNTKAPKCMLLIEEQNELPLQRLWEVQVNLEKQLGVRGGKDQNDLKGYEEPDGVVVRETVGSLKLDAKLATSSGQDCTRNARISESSSSEDEATEVLSSCLKGLEALWRDEGIRHILRKRKVKLNYNAEFFLDNLYRITQCFYEPSSDDILHAYRRTQGVEECLLNMERGFPSYGGAVGRQWLLYDMGGSKILTDAWLSFFDNVHVIIFLQNITLVAPSSDFNESHSENSRFNRLEKSFLLWRSLCSSRLLTTIPIVLLLSKCDVLKRKLDSGVMFRDTVPSFGEGSNDTNTVIKYLQEKFREQLKERSPVPRISYSHSGSLVESHTILISAIISAVEDSIRHSYLKAVQLI